MTRISNNLSFYNLAPITKKFNYSMGKNNSESKVGELTPNNKFLVIAQSAPITIQEDSLVMTHPYYEVLDERHNMEAKKKDLVENIIKEIQDQLMNKIKEHLQRFLKDMGEEMKNSLDLKIAREYKELENNIFMKNAIKNDLALRIDAYIKSISQEIDKGLNSKSLKNDLQRHLKNAIKSIKDLPDQDISTKNKIKKDIKFLIKYLLTSFQQDFKNNLEKNIDNYLNDFKKSFNNSDIII